MYGPATTLTMLADLDEKVLIGILGVVGTLYTTIGGIRGVIWNDFFQCLLMFTSIVVIIIKGIYDIGGVSRMLEINEMGGRLKFLNLDPSPFVRQSSWSLFFCQLIYMMSPYCFDQQMMQRFQVSQKYNLEIISGSSFSMNLIIFTFQ